MAHTAHDGRGRQQPRSWYWSWPDAEFQLGRSGDAEIGAPGRDCRGAEQHQVTQIRPHLGARRDDELEGNPRRLPGLEPNVPADDVDP